MRYIRLRDYTLMTDNNFCLFSTNREFNDAEEEFRWLLEVELLIVLTNEISEWIKCILPEETITFHSIFDDLKDGVILCKLLGEFEKYFDPHVDSKSSILNNYISHNSCFRDRSGFKSRVNISTFLHWCRKFKFHENFLFETNDCYESAVMGRRKVIICLWNIAKEFAKYGTPIPKLLDYQLSRQSASNKSKNNLTDVYIEYIATNDQSFDVHSEMKSQLPQIDMQDYTERLIKEKEKHTHHFEPFCPSNENIIESEEVIVDLMSLENTDLIVPESDDFEKVPEEIPIKIEGRT